MPHIRLAEMYTGKLKISEIRKLLNENIYVNMYKQRDFFVIQSLINKISIIYNTTHMYVCKRFEHGMHLCIHIIAGSVQHPLPLCWWCPFAQSCRPSSMRRRNHQITKLNKRERKDQKYWKKCYKYRNKCFSFKYFLQFSSKIITLGHLFSSNSLTMISSALYVYNFHVYFFYI